MGVMSSLRSNGRHDMLISCRALHPRLHLAAQPLCGVLVTPSLCGGPAIDATRNSHMAWFVDPSSRYGLGIRGVVTSSSSTVARGMTPAPRFAEESGGRLGELSAKMLCRLLAQPGALSDKAFTVAIECALARIDEMDGKDCVRFLNALSQTDRGAPALPPDGEALRKLGSRLSDRLGDVSLGDMAGLAETLANASVPSLPIFARLSAVFSLRSAGATATQLTQVATAFSKVRLADRTLFPRLAQTAIKQLHVFKSPELPAFIAAFATVGICHESLLLAASRLVASRAQRFSAVDLALIAYGYSQFFLVFPPVLAALRKRLPECAHELPAVRLAELVVSCSRLTLDDPRLLTTFARDVQLTGLSDPLFGQVAKSLAQMGLASAPAMQLQLTTECRLRLGGILNAHPHAVAGEWVLDMMDCLGEASEDARRRHGGAYPSFIMDALPVLGLALVQVCPALATQDIAGVYRSLRQLPPSVISISLSGLKGGHELWALHEQLAHRAQSLARGVSFSHVELASVMYSMVCLYPEVWAHSDAGHADAMNPQRRILLESWAALKECWQGSTPGGEVEDPVSRRQSTMVSSVLNQAREDMSTVPNADGDGNADVDAAGGTARRSRPVAIELLQILEELGFEDRQSHFWEGHVEVHAAVGRHCFCLMPEDAYFQRAGSTAAFVEAVADHLPPHDSVGTSTSGKSFDDELVSRTLAELELCLERAADINLLRQRGWQVTEVPYRVWRRLPASGRREFILRALQTGCER